MAAMETEETTLADLPRTVPESVLKKRKRDEQWALNRKEQLETRKARGRQNHKVVFKRAEQFVKEYRQQEHDKIRLNRQAKRKTGFYVEPETALLFAIRFRGVNDMHPKSRKILRLLRLQQIFNGVFLKVDKATMTMLQMVEPYVTYGYPSLKSVKELIYKRGYGKADGQRAALVDNSIIEEALGKYGILCMEDIVHEISTVGPHFTEVSNFLWPFKLSSPLSGSKKKSLRVDDIGGAGNQEDKINDLISKMN